MGHYYVKPMPPDGNCFFHALHCLLESRRDLNPVPSASEIRRTVAENMALKLFGRSCSELKEWLIERRDEEEEGESEDEGQEEDEGQSEEGMDVDMEKGEDSLSFLDDVYGSELLSTLKDAVNSHLSRVGTASIGSLSPMQAVVFVLLLEHDRTEDLFQYSEAAAGCGLDKAVDSLVWADADEGDFGGMAASGIVLDAVKDAYSLDRLQIVTFENGDTRYRGKSVLSFSEKQDELFLYFSGGHFDALLWNDSDRPNPLSSRQVDSGTSDDSAPISLKIARQTDNTLAGSVLFGAVTWNFNHLGLQSKSSLINAFSGKDHDRNSAARKIKDKLLALEALIVNNSHWLDVIALQEVNQGIDYLARKDIQQWKRTKNLTGLKGDDLYTYYRGPKFQSVAASGSLTSGQPEYYPLLVPKNRQRRPALEYLGWAAVFAGRPDVDEGDKDSVATLYWAKRDAYKKLLAAAAIDLNNETDCAVALKAKEAGEAIKKIDNRLYRPVLVHRLLLDEQRINVAVVHTTPWGTELNRTEVFFQVNDFFRRVSSGELDRAQAGERPDLWIVTGDYYLFGEAAVFASTALESKDAIMQARIERYLKGTVDEYAEIYTLLTTVGISTNDKQSTVGQQDKRKGKRDRMDQIQVIPKESRLPIPHAVTTSESELIYTDSEVRANYSDKLSDAIKLMNTIDVSKPDKAISCILSLEQDLLKVLHKAAGPNKKHKGRGSGEGEGESEAASARNDQRKDANAATDEDAKISGESYFARSRLAAYSPFIRLRNVLGYSFAERVGGSFQILQPPAATNVHTSAVLDKPKGSTALTGKWGQDQSKDQTVFRIADFFVVDQRWLSHEVGMLVDKNGGGMVWVDDEAATQSQRWRQISDHFPMGVRLSTAPRDRRVERSLVEDKMLIRNIAQRLEAAAQRDLQALKRRTEREDWKAANAPALYAILGELLGLKDTDMK